MGTSACGGSGPVRRLLSWIGKLILHTGWVGSGRAVGPLSFWLLWQWVTRRYYRLRPVRPGGLLMYTVRRYRGQPFRLADGSMVLPGEHVAELHVDNGSLVARLLGEARSRRAAPWSLLGDVANDLSALTGRLDPAVKALHGVTLLAGAAPRLGFEKRDLHRTAWNDLVRFFMLGLLAIYSPEGRRRLARTREDLYPAEVWMARSTLMARYGGAGRGSGGQGSLSPTGRRPGSGPGRRLPPPPAPPRRSSPGH